MALAFHHRCPGMLHLPDMSNPAPPTALQLLCHPWAMEVGGQSCPHGCRSLPCIAALCTAACSVGKQQQEALCLRHRDVWVSGFVLSSSGFAVSTKITQPAPELCNSAHKVLRLSSFSQSGWRMLQL